MSIKVRRVLALIAVLALFIGVATFLLRLKTPVFLGGDDVILQRAENDCGIAAVKNVLKKLSVNPARADSLLTLSESGVSMLDMKQAFLQCGFSAKGYKTVMSELDQLQFPMIAHFNKNHFVVVEAVDDNSVTVIDPAIGRMRYPKEAFQERWDGLVLCVERDKTSN